MKNQRPSILLILCLLVVAVLLICHKQATAVLGGWASLDFGTQKLLPSQQNDGSLRAGSSVTMSKLTGTGTGTKTSTWTGTATASSVNNTDTATINVALDTSTLVTTAALTSTLASYALTSTLSNYIPTSSTTAATVAIDTSGYITTGTSTATASWGSVFNTPVIHVSNVPGSVVAWPLQKQYLMSRAFTLMGATAPLPEPFYDNFLQYASSQAPLGIASGNTSWSIVAPGKARCSTSASASQSCTVAVGSLASLFTATPASQAWYAAIKMAWGSTTSATSFCVVQITDGTRYAMFGHHGAYSTTQWGANTSENTSWVPTGVSVDSTPRLLEAYATGTTAVHVLIDGVEFASIAMTAAASWGATSYMRFTCGNGGSGGAKIGDVYGWTFTTTSPTF